MLKQTPQNFIQYIPYGLQCLHVKSNLKITINGIDIDGLEVKYKLNTVKNYDEDWVEINEIIPILYHINDLDKPLTISSYNNGEAFIPCIEIAKLEYSLADKYIIHNEDIKYVECFYGDISMNVYYDVECLNYKALNLLHQWNFDYNDLIDNKLALNKKEY